MAAVASATTPTQGWAESPHHDDPLTGLLILGGVIALVVFIIWLVSRIEDPSPN